MKIVNLTGLVCLVGFLLACRMFGTQESSGAPANSNDRAETVKTTPATAPSPAESKPPEFTGEVKFPFDDFPAVETTAKPGEYVLAPSYGWMVDALQKGVDKTTFIWYSQKMSKPGAEKSEVQFMSDRKEVPNAYIIPIPPGARAKKGDILLTWWQSGSGLERAIVTDAADPLEPVVRYLDIDYDNPAKSRDGRTTIGQMDEKLKPDTFVVIKKEMEPGTAVAIRDGADLKHGQLIRAAGEKVFVREFAGRIGVYPKADATAVPLRPNVREGDRVKAVSIGKFRDGTVTRIDDSIGRVWVKFDQGGKEKAIAYGDVFKN